MIKKSKFLYLWENYFIYRFCLSKDITHKSIGRYIDATSAKQVDKLNQIFEKFLIWE